MKIDFTVYDDPKNLPDLYSNVARVQRCGIDPGEEASIIKAADMRVPPNTPCGLYFGRPAYFNNDHTSVVLNTCERDAGVTYPLIMKGTYADLLPVWRAYALLTVDGKKK